MIKERHIRKDGWCSMCGGTGAPEFEHEDEVTLESLVGPACVLRVHFGGGEDAPMVTVEWTESPSIGEIIVSARGLLGLQP